MDREWAEKLENARNTGNLQAMVVRTKIDGNDLVRDPEFDVKDWSEIGLSSF